MKYSDLKKVLKNHKLRITDTRMDVLEYFVKQRGLSSTRTYRETVPRSQANYNATSKLQRALTKAQN